MKKMCILLALILCFSLSACGGSTDTESDSGSSTISGETTTEESENSEVTVPDVDSADESTMDADLQETDTSEQDSTPRYFESDEVVEKFFSDYNAIAEIIIPAEEIEKGNIRTKALVYIDDLSLEIINAEEFLSISMSSSVENEDTKLYVIFRDAIWAMKSDLSEDSIQACWQAIHESGYLVEDYDFEGINVTYVPAKELSWGTSNLRVDLEIPLE